MPNKYIKNLRQAIVSREAEKGAICRGVLEVIRSACRGAVKKFPSLTRIMLVGSIVSGGFSENSDVDIVIAGLGEKNYFSLAIFLENKIGRRIDLIMEEELAEKDRKHICGKKEIIYGSQES